MLLSLLLMPIVIYFAIDTYLVIYFTHHDVTVYYDIQWKSLVPQQTYLATYSIYPARRAGYVYHYLYF